VGEHGAHNGWVCTMAMTRARPRQRGHVAPWTAAPATLQPVLTGSVPTDFGNLHDRARLGALDGSAVRRIFVERKMRASPVIVRKVAGQNTAQVSFAQDENMIQALAPHRADEPLRDGILPGTLRHREHFLDLHAPNSAPELLAVDLVTIAQEISLRTSSSDLPVVLITWSAPKTKKLSNRRVNIILNILRQSLDRAVAKSWFEQNHARRVDLLREERPEIDPLSRSEVKTFPADGLREEEDCRYFVVAIFSGLRAGEEIGLQ
jgi:hypothetical protein